MIRPEDVTDAMVRAALSKWFGDPPSGEVEYLRALAPAMRETIAAAINASGCVLAPAQPMAWISHSPVRGDHLHFTALRAMEFSSDIIPLYAAAANPRQQAQDTGKEN